MRRIVGLAAISALAFGVCDVCANAPKENGENNDFIEDNASQDSAKTPEKKVEKNVTEQGAKDDKTATQDDGGQTSKNAAINAIMKKMEEMAPKKEQREFTTFDMTTAGELKAIEVNSVNFIKLKDKAGQIFIPNPTVADVDVIDDSSLYLTGLQAGTTSLVVQDKEGNVIANYRILVTYPLSDIQKYLKERNLFVFLPKNNVNILIYE